MRYTNPYKMPDSIYRACAPADQHKPDPKRIGVTTLISPVQIRSLTMKHWDEIEVDASARLWAVLGEGVHLVMDKYSPPKDKEQLNRKLEFVIGDMTIVGIVDTFDIKDTGIIEDHKCTSVYSFLLGVKQEWTEQLNVYAWLAEKNGIHIKGLKINAFLRDWQASKANYGTKIGDGGEIERWGTPRQTDYPKIPFQSVDIPLWPLNKIEEFVRFRLAEHQKCVILCTDEERWRRPEVWAVMKKGRKSAVACNSYLDGDKIPFTKEDAEKWMRTNAKKGEDLYLEQRKGACIRCQSYCQVANFCKQNKGE